MDQLHEELKEPLTECNMSGEGSDSEEIRDGDRSPSEDEFLSCDSGSSSDRGEGGGTCESELLLQDECDSVRLPAAEVAGTGTLISEKERLKEKRVSGSPLRGGSQEMDEDADVDTAADQEASETGGEGDERGEEEQEEEEEELTTPTETEGQCRDNNQLSDGGRGQTQSASGVKPAGLTTAFKEGFSFVSKPARCLLFCQSQTTKQCHSSNPSPLPAARWDPCRSCTQNCRPAPREPAPFAPQDPPTPSKKVQEETWALVLLNNDSFSLQMATRLHCDME